MCFTFVFVCQVIGNMCCHYVIIAMVGVHGFTLASLRSCHIDALRQCGVSSWYEFRILYSISMSCCSMLVNGSNLNVRRHRFLWSRRSGHYIFQHQLLDYGIDGASLDIVG